MTWHELVAAVLGPEASRERRGWVIGYASAGAAEWYVCQRTALCEWRSGCSRIAGAFVVDGLALCVTHWGVWQLDRIGARIAKLEEEV